MNSHKSFTNRKQWTQLSQLETFQKECHEKFLNLQIPTQKDEKWKYTKIPFLKESNFKELNFIQPQTSLSFSDLSPLHCIQFIRKSKSNLIVIENGQLRQDLCEIVDNDLHLSITRGLNLSPKTLEKFIYENESFFSLMNSALFCDTCHLHITKKANIQRPIFIIQIHGDHAKNLHHKDLHRDLLPKDLGVSFPHLLIELEEGVSTSLAEIHIDHINYKDKTKNNNAIQNFVNSQTLIHLKEHAKLNYLKCQDKSLSSYSYSKINIDLKQRANLQFLSLDLGSLWSRQDLTLRHRERAATSQVHGLYMASEESHIDCYTSIEHEKGQGVSHQLYKGILNDKAKAVFNGRIFIAPQAQKVNSSQLNKNLLLSHEAEVNTKPEFEIYADDVKATHGATIGRVNEEEIFYLMSRGIPKQQAESLLIKGFFENLVMDMEVPEFCQLASEMMTQHLK